MAELGEQARGLSAFLRARLGQLQGRLQADCDACVARQAEEIADAVVLAPGHRRIVGEA